MNDELLKQALKVVYDEKYHYEPGKEDTTIWNFSKEYQFEKKMDKLIKSQKKPYWKYINTVGKKAAVIIVFLIITFSSAMSVPAFREPVIEFVVNTYHKFSEYYVDEDIFNYSNEKYPETILEKYIPTDIPKSYIIDDSYEDDYLIVMSWKDRNDNKIVFYQRTITTKTNLNTENNDIKKITINDSLYYTYTESGTTVYLWQEYGYLFILNTPENMSKENVLKIIDSIQKK